MMTSDLGGDPKSSTPHVTRELLISLYMEKVLNEEKFPTSIYKFCKEHNFTEPEFYSFFGSFEGIQLEIWNDFFFQAMSLLKKEESFNGYSSKEKLLSFYYTFFEILTLNRSYILIALKDQKNVLESLRQLKGLRFNIKKCASQIMEEENKKSSSRLLKQPVSIFSEGIWLQTLFLLKFWMDDNSEAFEKTDIAIEKSVKAAFDVFDTRPLESVLDLGKFIWKEK